MNYEFFFVRRKARKTPKFIRVYGPDAGSAGLLLARHFGYKNAATDPKAVRAFLRSRNLHPACVATVFARPDEAALRGPEAA